MKIPVTARWVITAIGFLLVLVGLLILGATFDQWLEYPATTMISGGNTMLYLGFGLTGVGVATALTAWTTIKGKDGGENN